MKTLDGSSIPYNFANREEIPYEGDDYVPHGKQALVLTDGELVDEARELFGRPDACLKLFLVPLDGTFKDYYWGGPFKDLSLERTVEVGKTSKLWEATVIQNLLWLEGLAARVYGFVTVVRDGKHYPAQVVEYLEGEQGKSADWVQEQRKIHQAYLDQFACVVQHEKQAGTRDFIDGKLIDPQGCRFTEDTEEKIKEYIINTGRYGKGHYQSVPQLGIKGKPRNTLMRIEDMKLEDVNFEGKTVLDVGCNSGVFCNYAMSRGARRVLGVDLADNIKAAQVLAFYLGYHNNDYYAGNVQEMDLDWEFDITFFLSMNVHVGFPEWIGYATKELMIFEENAKGGRYDTKKWRNYFRNNFFKDVIQRGVTTDHNAEQPKPVLHCYK